MGNQIDKLRRQKEWIASCTYVPKHIRDRDIEKINKLIIKLENEKDN